MHDEMFTKRIYLIAQHDWLSPCVVQHVRVLPCEGDQSVWANSERWARPRLLCRSIYGLDDNDQCKSVDGIMVLMVIIMVVVMVKMVAAINFASRICSSLSVTLVPLWKGWWFLIKKYNERVIESGNKYICWWFLQNIFDDDFHKIYLMAMVPMQAMARGLGSRLQQPMFTTCGKIKVKVVKSKIDLKFAVKF